MNKPLLILFLFIQCIAIRAWPVGVAVDSPATLVKNAKILRNEWTPASIQASLDSYSRAKAGWQKLGRISDAASCDLEIARLELMRNNRNAAIERLTFGLKDLTEKEFIPDRARSVSLLALIHLGTDRTILGEKFVYEATKLAALTNDRDAKAYASASAARLYEIKRDFPQSLRSYKSAVDLWGTVGDANSKAYALWEMSYVLLSAGEPLQGLNNIDIAQEEFNRVGDRRGLSLSFIAKGHLHSAIGEKQKALEFYKNASDLFPLDLDLHERASLENGLGYVFEEFTEWKLSLTHRKKAIELFEQQNQLFGKLSTLPSLVKLSFEVGDQVGAFEYMAQTEALSARLGDKFWTALGFKQVAEFYFGQGSNDESLKFYERSVKILAKAGLKVEVALIYDRLGMIHERRKDYMAARQFYYRALKISRKISHRISEASIIFNLARLASIEDRDDEALELARRSIEITDSIFADVANSRSRGSYISSVFPRYEFLTSLLMKIEKKTPGQGFALQALQVVERSKARAMLENITLAESNFAADADPEAVNREKATRILLRSRADKLTELLSGRHEQTEVDELDAEIGEIESELENIIAELKQKSPVYSAIKDPALFDPAEFQKKILDDQSVFLEFALGDADSYLWVISQTGIDFFTLPPRDQIESRVERLRAILKKHEFSTDEAIDEYQTRRSDADLEYWQEAHKLSDEILGPAGAKLAGKRLIIAADGKLHYFPLASLPQPNTASDDPLLLTNEIVRVPSASALRLIASRPDRPVSSEKDILIFADPVYAKTDERLSGIDSVNPTPDSQVTGNLRSFESLHSLSRLPGSDKEAVSIAKVIGSDNATIRSGFEANRQSVLAPDVTNFKIIHFAAHGLIEEDRPELSGIVLSLFDRAGEPQDGGIIRLQDVYGMRLGADIVVLSACDTGMGKEVKGEGLVSLNNAFIQAGARTVISSLWKVDDTATQVLMTEFYRTLVSDRLTAAAALRNAQLKMYRDPRFRSPFYWASFTAHGDMWKVPAFENHVDYRYLILPTIPILLVGIYLLKKHRRSD